MDDDFRAFEGTFEPRRRKVANSAGVAYAKRLFCLADWRLAFDCEKRGRATN